ncbi:hypothetical protein HWV62_9437 [Athelia sp. TMB]|nr:hypothetical protein HWV62_9437 [Athelia sp. TMB]
MRSPTEDDVPLLTEEKEDADFYPSTCEAETGSIRRCYIATVLLVSLGSNVVLLLATAYLAVRQSQSIEWKGARPVFTPAREAVIHELVQFASVRHTKSRFDGPPTDEVDAAWHELYGAGISAIPKSAAALLPNRTEAYTGDEQHYIIELDVFHQLHCLVRFFTIIGKLAADLIGAQNLVRKAAWPEHYPDAQEARYSLLKGGGVFDHVDHCLNAIRESLVCNADLTPVTWHWNERDQISGVEFNAVHTCVNWDNIHAWAAENAARIKFNAHHHVQDDLVFPDDPKF